MTKNEIQLLAMGIITKIERHGGNFDLRPKVYKDGIAVNYTTDCDRAGDVENREEDYLIGFPRELRQEVVDTMNTILAGGARRT
jgi:hypothetical protein